MKRDDLVVIAALGFILLFALGVVWLMPLPAHAESRVYPFVGAMYRVETGLAPRPWLEGGAAVSYGPIAPSLTLQIPVTGQFSPGVEFRVRVKL